MRSLWAESFGAISLRISSSLSLVWAATRLKKTLLTRLSIRPERSSSTKVFSKLGGSVWLAMAFA